MIGDHVTLSEPFLDELIAIGLSVEDLEDAFEQKWRNRLRSHGIIDKIPASEAFDVFFVNVNKITSDHVLSESTIETYKQILKTFYNYCRQRGHDVDVGEMMTYVMPFLTEYLENHEPKFKDSTMNKYCGALRTFMDETSRHYKLGPQMKPPLRRLTQRLPQALSDADVRQLLDKASSTHYGLRARFMMSFFLATGVRRNEFANIQLKDLDFDRMTVKVTGKGNRQRVIPVPHELRPLLMRYLQVYGLRHPLHYLYPPIGKPEKAIANSTLDHIATRLFTKLDSYQKDDKSRGYHLHSLRHSYAVGLLRGGTHLRSIAQVLGHRSTQTTNIYTLLDTERLREILAPGLDKIAQWWR